MEKIVKEIYTNPADPGSFGGVNRLLKSIQNRGIKINRSKLVNILKDIDSYTLHKPIRRRFSRNPIIVGGIDRQWQADLVDMSVEQKYNDGARYILTCIDCFSKFAWAVPIRTKEGKSIIEAFQIIMTTRKPIKIQTDKGKEFFNDPVQKYFKSNKIHHFTTENETKAAIVERFNRTLKTRMWAYFTANNTRRYVDILKKLVHSYNNSIHRTIGMKPSDVQKKHESIIFNRIYSRNPGITSIFTRSKSHGYVRISKHKTAFEKGYLPNWTGEVFKLKEKVDRGPKALYKLSDLKDEDISGEFYPEEIQHIQYNPDKLYPIEKIIKSRTAKGKKEQFVKWLNWPDKFNSWINASEIENIAR